jgi:pimeloyl-ACP methyl ester carboxylesterase
VPFPVVAQSSAWVDPSPSHILFVAVEKNVSLEVLDWGGSGRPVVLLAGAGDTAHVFDGFAPLLAARYHVYGITRRGFGASGYAPSDDMLKRLADDILAVLDSLHLRRPVLIGHSFGGAELTWIANNHPDRVAALVYLDAGYSYAFDDGTVENVMTLKPLHTPHPPAPASSDLASFTALAKFDQRINGIAIPEAELRQQFITNPNGTVGAQRQPPGYAMIIKLVGTPSKYSAIPAPALLIFANPHTFGTWVEHSTDPTVRSDAKLFSAAMDSLVAKQVNAIKRAVPSAQVLTIPNADHYIYLSNQPEVLRDIQSFIAALP